MSDRRRRRPALRLVAALLFACLAAAPMVAGAMGDGYYTTALTRVMIMGLAASGLNIALGYGGMVSFGHALYLGIGAYAVGILAAHGIVSGPVQFAAALACGIAAAVLVGAVCLRTSGVAFIMITLALAQMGYYFVIGLKQYGGEDGLPLPQRSQFGVLDFGNPTQFYYIVFAVLVIALWLISRGARSRFGMIVAGCRTNERRMAALGFSPFRYRLTAYVLSAAICVLAGALLVNLTRFASPSFVQWTTSGELIVMVVLGGTGTVLGPIVGAAVLVLLETVLSGVGFWGLGSVGAVISAHWLAVLGVVVLATALSFRRGLVGALADTESGP